MNYDRGKLTESGHGNAALLPFPRSTHDVSVRVRYLFGGKTCQWSRRAKANLDLLHGPSLGS